MRILANNADDNRCVHLTFPISNWNAVNSNASKISGTHHNTSRCPPPPVAGCSIAQTEWLLFLSASSSSSSSYSHHIVAPSWFQLEVPGLSSASMLEVGPVALSFELPKVTATGLQIRFLRLSPIQPGPSQRWVRYSTLSDSYTIRV